MPSPRPWTKPGERRNRSRLVRASRLLRTRNPRTFNEKVRYKLLRDHRPLMVTFADKAAMRQHVASLVGESYLPQALLLERATDLRDARLAVEFVLKPTHGSGACVVVDRQAPADARLPVSEHSWVYARVRPEHAPLARLEAIAEHWLSKRYGRGPNHEWAYSRAGRRLLVEELLGPDIPEDYKLFVFHGRCHFVQVDNGRFGVRTQDFFDRDWRALDLSGGHPRRVDVPRPETLEEMITVAERLSAGTDFVRVDLYAIQDRVVVGELTSSPAGGDSPFAPESWNAVFGEPWTVPSRYL